MPRFLPAPPHAALLLTGVVAFASACGETVITIAPAPEPESAAHEPEPPVMEPEPVTTAEPEPVGPSEPSAPPEPEPVDAGPQTPPMDIERGLLAYLPFDESEAGATAVDASGNGHDGTPSANPPTPSASGPPVGFDDPWSLGFDGVGQLIDLGNPAALDIAGNVTVAAWVRPVSLNGYRNIVAHGFRWTPDEELVLRINEGFYEFLSWSGPGRDHRARARVPDGDIDNWHHLVGVYDGTRYRLFRDGVLLAEQEDEFAPTRVDAPWAIGGRSATTPPEDRFFEGWIDEVRIYERDLSEEEIRELFRR